MRAHASFKSRQRGSVIVEFLMVMPAFVVLSMFVLEVGLMWADRHVTRLAAFEAARVFAAANLPEWTDEGPKSNPCEAPQTILRAKRAALRKLAIVAPPLPLYVARLGSFTGGISLGSVDTALQGALARLAKRWPTAVASTDMGCTYDPELGEVSVTIRYNRMLQTPVIDRVMFLVYKFSQLSAHGGLKLSLDSSFMGVGADHLSPLALAQAGQALTQAFEQIQNLGMTMSDAADFLSGVPELSKIFSSIPSVPTDIGGLGGDPMGQVIPSLGSVGGVQSTIDQQSAVLTALVAKFPEALWRIPITAKVNLQREAFAQQVDSGAMVRDKRWAGVMNGALLLDDQGFRTWAQNLSKTQHSQALSTDAKPIN